MGVIDWIILAVLLVLGIQGFRKGFAKTAVHIGGTIATFFLIGQFYPLLRNILREQYNLKPVLATTLAVLLFLLIMAVLVLLLTWLLNKVLKAIRLSGVNKVMGLALGLLHGLLAVMVCMVVLDYLPKLSTPLKDPESHKVYYRVDVVKNGIFRSMNLQQKDKYLELLKPGKTDQRDR